MPVIWMADHNMVMVPHADEERGTQKPRGEKQQWLVDEVEATEEALSGAKMIDAFRAQHGASEKAYTRGVRRLDRATTSAVLTNTAPGAQCAGTIAAMRHIEQEDLEVASGATGGTDQLKMHRPDHKAVEVTLRFTKDPKARPPWALRGQRYDKATWEAMRTAITNALGHGAQPETETTPYD